MISTDLYGKVNGLFHDKTRWDLREFCYRSSNLNYFKPKFTLNNYYPLYSTFENGFKTLDFYDENFDNRYAFEFLRNDKEYARVIYTLQLLSSYKNDDSSSLLYLACISKEVHYEEM